ncbi:hypothetical protein LSUE1_G000465 [Lachnellula suecica]|uniref:Uncharacterized protein n=1 Tax=Lachnellula suecica TaxID=602035 RepID=A0A8T9CP12_9HELO|nr:hypothetical protein LSUE1_G000465 [Lachnellula suecica]
MAGKSTSSLPEVHRFITDHDADGKAVFNKSVPEEGQWQPISDAANFFLAYTTHGFPIALNPAEKAPDVTSYKNDLETVKSLTVDNGSVLRFVDFAPDTEPIMHRTTSLDYGVVLEGAVECHLDSGEVKTLQRGDVCVQRATNHAWKNISENGGWARMMFVLLPSEAPVVGGKTLGLDLGSHMPDTVEPK